MTHPLANDSSLPPALAAAFARVRWQVVTVLSDGMESVVNCRTQAQVDEYVSRNADIQRSHDERGFGFSDGRTIVRTYVREI